MMVVPRSPNSRPHPTPCYTPTHARPENPLYVMAKPEVQAQIAALPRDDPSRGPHLLHVTLISLCDLHELRRWTTSAHHSISSE